MKYTIYLSLLFFLSCNYYESKCLNKWGWYEHVLNEYSDEKEYVFLDSVDGYYLHKVIINLDTLIDTNILRINGNEIWLDYYINRVERSIHYPVGAYQNINYSIDYPYLKHGGIYYIEYKRMCQ